jgi:hypothetical protein
LDIRGAMSDSIVEPFDRRLEVVDYDMALFPVPFIWLVYGSDTDKPSNQTMQPTASRRTASFSDD